MTCWMYHKHGKCYTVSTPLFHKQHRNRNAYYRKQTAHTLLQHKHTKVIQYIRLHYGLALLNLIHYSRGIIFSKQLFLFAKHHFPIDIPSYRTCMWTRCVLVGNTWWRCVLAMLTLSWKNTTTYGTTIAVHYVTTVPTLAPILIRITINMHIWCVYGLVQAHTRTRRANVRLAY